MLLSADKSLIVLGVDGIPQLYDIHTIKTVDIATQCVLTVTLNSERVHCHTVYVYCIKFSFSCPKSVYA